MPSHERFAVRQLSTLVAGPDQESERCKKSDSINANAPQAQEVAEKHRDRERKSAPHVADNEFSFVTTAPGEKPAEEDRDEGANRGEQENKARRFAQMIPSAKEADTFQKRDE